MPRLPAAAQEHTEAPPAEFIRVERLQQRFAGCWRSSVIRGTFAAMTASWSDEFDGPSGSAVDPSVWALEVGGHGWGNGELQSYTEGTANAALDGHGNLAVTARRDGSGRCTSARLVSKNRFAFRYGLITARVRLPGGRGIWPAFWMLGHNIDRTEWPGCGEIDVLECFGTEDESRTVHGTVHGPGYAGDEGVSGSYTSGLDLSAGFHDFAVRWEPDRIVWLLDGEEFHRVTPGDLPGPWVFDHEFYLLLNVAVGGSLSVPPDEEVFARTLLVDHVRIDVPDG
jgi:beta-glucanase (GH16 family)